MAQAKVESLNITRASETELVTGYSSSGVPAAGKFHIFTYKCSNELKFDKASTTTAGGPSWQNYEPQRTSPGDAYDTFLDELGFTNNVAKRNEFVDELVTHADSSMFRYLRREENPKEFGEMVLDFLRSYGDKYWGVTARRHLCEPNPQRGFLCPRDAFRPYSRYVLPSQALKHHLLVT